MRFSLAQETGSLILFDDDFLDQSGERKENCAIAEVNFEVTDFSLLWRDNLGNAGTCPTVFPGCYRPPEDEVPGVQTSYVFNEIWNADADDSGGVCDQSSGFCSADDELRISSANCPLWICRGMTGRFGNYSLDRLVGYEAERVFPNHSYPNRALQIIGDSPVYNLLVNGTLAYTGRNSNAVYFTLPNQAKVFSAGTVQFSWGLDDYAPVDHASGARLHPVRTNNNAQTLTANMLDCLINGACQ